MTSYKLCASFPFLSMFLLAIPCMPAQQVAAPAAYSLVETNSLFFGNGSVSIYRDGPQAVMETSIPAGGNVSKPVHTRSFYDLQKNVSYTWDLNDASVPCNLANFSGDWGDPFAASAQMTADLPKESAAGNATEKVNGIPARVAQDSGPGGEKVKMWIEPKSGLVLKLSMTGKDGNPQTLVEVKQFSLSAPPASVFQIPSACVQAAAAAPPSDAARIDQETGGYGADFADAVHGASTTGDCTVVFRVVQAGSLQPVTGGYQVAIDRTSNFSGKSGNSQGTLRISAAHHADFSSTPFQEITANMHNGAIRIANPPSLFMLEVVLAGDGSVADALIHRQCYGPETPLLLVMKNPQTVADGTDWLFDKTGKHGR